MHECSQNCIFDENDFLVSLYESTGENSDIIICKVDKNSIEVALVFCKTYRKSAIFHTTLFAPRELISKMESWKSPILGACNFVSKTQLGIFDIRFPSFFFPAFLQKKKTPQFLNSHTLRTKQKFKNSHRFADPGFFHVSKKRTCV